MNLIAYKGLSSRLVRAALLLGACPITAAGVAHANDSNPIQLAQANQPNASQNAAVDRGAEANGFEEIIVTSRKREESLLKAPVVEVVVTEKMLETRATKDLFDVVAAIPGLIMGSIGNASPMIAMRGIGSTAFDPGAPSSVLLNLDGLSLSSGFALNSGLFDLQQIEALKGPQALFFGKSATGGVLSLRTNDPGDKPEIIVSSGYEVEAQEWRTEAILSTPVTDKFGIRIAGMYDHSNGYWRDEGIGVAAIGGVNPKFPRSPNSENYIMRGTMVFKPSDVLTARLKVNVQRDYSLEYGGGVDQPVSCPDRTLAPFGDFIDARQNCSVINRINYDVDNSPAAFPGIPNGGNPFVYTLQRFGTLELNYHPAGDLTLTSVTGYYNLKSNISGFVTRYRGRQHSH